MRDRGNFAQRATRKIVGIIIGVLILMPLVIFLFGEIVLHLWNWLMPMLFHLAPLSSFWQALGLMVLSWILFGGLRGLSGRGRRCRYGHWRGRMQERWEEMTPEERERFREWVRARSGPFATDAPTNV
jgi:Ca2+/H+ antiporter, TMEM165/GDT1 family